MAYLTKLQISVISLIVTGILFAIVTISASNYIVTIIAIIILILLVIWEIWSWVKIQKALEKEDSKLEAK